MSASAVIVGQLERGGISGNSANPAYSGHRGYGDGAVNFK